MNVAYGWAFFNPVRKVYYNLAITGLSVVICFFIGTVEVLGLLPDGAAPEGRLLELHGQLQHQHGGLRHRRAVRRHLGGGALIWKYGQVEEKWTAKLTHPTAADQFEEDLAAQYEAEIAVQGASDPRSGPANS